MHLVSACIVQSGECLIPEQVGANLKKIWQTIADYADRTFEGVKAESYAPRGVKEAYLSTRWIFINPTRREILRTLALAALCFVPGGYLLTFPYHTLRFYLGVLLTIKVAVVLLGHVRAWIRGNTLETALALIIKNETGRAWGEIPTAANDWHAHIQDRNFKNIDPDSPLAATSNSVARIGEEYLLFKFEREEDGKKKTFIKAYYIANNDFSLTNTFKYERHHHGLIAAIATTAQAYLSQGWFYHKTFRDGTKSQDFRDGSYVLDISSLLKGKSEIPMIKQALREFKNSDAWKNSKDSSKIEFSEDAPIVV